MPCAPDALLVVHLPRPLGRRPYARQCFGLTSPRWSPTPDDSEIVSGQVAWSCRDDEDCSLNGKCGSRTASRACRPQWGGDRCETLRLGPAARNSGYRAVDGNHNTSSWGGAVLRDDAGGSTCGRRR